MSDSTRHIHLEKLGSELTVETTKKHPGTVFLQITGAGFGFCMGLTAKDARYLGMAFFDAMDATEEEKAKVLEG